MCVFGVWGGLYVVLGVVECGFLVVGGDCYDWNGFGVDCDG